MRWNEDVVKKEKICVEGQDIVDKKMSHDIVDNAL
jgi:hypothetical protein